MYWENRNDVKFADEARTGIFRPLDASSCGPHLHSNKQVASTDLAIMAPKTYKELKEAWVTGHTGSSVADVNSVSLAMPVPYTFNDLLLRALLTTSPS